MRVLKPIKITPAVLVSTTATDATTAWVSGTTYVYGATVKRSQRLYRRSVAGAGTVVPELDTANWVDGGPTNDWAMFDVENFTVTTGPAVLTVVANVGYFSALYLSGLIGTSVTVTVRATPGGTVIYTSTAALSTRIVNDWYDFYFAPFVQQEDTTFENLPIAPSAQLTVTITDGTAAACASLDVGNIFVFGGTEYGAKAEIKSYSTVKTDAFGRLTTVKRYSAKTMTARVLVDLKNANAAQAVLDDLDAVNAVYIATTLGAYGPLRVRGIASGPLSFDLTNYCYLNLTVTGTI